MTQAAAKDISERFLVQVARDFCHRHGYRLHVMSQGWLLKIETEAASRLIFGYDLGLNTSSAQQVANDKSATYDILALAGVPVIKHDLFHTPLMRQYVGESGNWRRMIELFFGYGEDVVCKSHAGTGGNRVFRARTPLELEECAQILFGSGRALTISPFVDITDEYRVVVLNGVPQLTYRKKRPSVTGDGCATIAELIGRLDGLGAPPEETAGARVDLKQVPAAGEQVIVEWRHNLARGAVPLVIAGEEALPVCELAVRAAGALGLRFASVDIADSGLLQVLEVNAGVMMESFAAFGPTHRAQAQLVYEASLEKLIEP